MISIYQGENEDVRHNQFIGEFLLEGLSEVEAGNEILVRFALGSERHSEGRRPKSTPPGCRNN